MKKTLTINLGGIVYHIDDDAYRLLDNYLSNLKHYFRKQEGAEEIVDDIEMRIAELFAEKVTEGKQVITVSDVEEIIARVGKPEDFGIADEDTDSQKRTEQASSANQSNTQTSAQRRWFRDPDNKLLGGVAAGLAAPDALRGAISTAIKPPRKQISTPIPKPKRTIANTSIQKCTPGTKRNRQSAITFINPNTKAGILRLPENILSEMIPENTVPMIPQIELIDIIKLASSVEYPF